MCPSCCWTMHPRWQRHWPMAQLTKHCSSLPPQQQLPTSAGWLSWIVNIDRPFVKGHPEQHNWPHLSPGCLGATWQARSTLIMQLVRLECVVWYFILFPYFSVCILNKTFSLEGQKPNFHWANYTLNKISPLFFLLPPIFQSTPLTKLPPIFYLANYTLNKTFLLFFTSPYFFLNKLHL